MVTCVGLLVAVLILLGINAPRQATAAAPATDPQPSQILNTSRHAAMPASHVTRCAHDGCRSFGSWNANGTCALPDQSTLTYDQCAAVGQGVGNLTKAAFTYSNATCNYTSNARCRMRMCSGVVHIAWVVHIARIR